MAVRTQAASQTMQLGASAVWFLVAAACAAVAASGPEAALAHAGWCLSAEGPGLAGMAVMAHCPWCYGAVGAAAAAIGLAWGALRPR